mgnify:CR=1 FL=1
MVDKLRKVLGWIWHNKERMVLVVMVDAANDWEWWAPKAANIILHGYFRDLGFDEAVADLRQGPRPLWYM